MKVVPYSPPDAEGTNEPVKSDPPEGFRTNVKTIQALDSRVSRLEIDVDRLACLDDAVPLIIDRNCNDITQLQVLLKTTITAVDRLAHGKSFGALGLPGEEDWNPS